MKKRIYILLVVMAFGLTTNALAQSFSTGSDMMNTGSSLSSNVYGVGAGSIDPMYGTTANGPMRRTVTNGWEDTEDNPGNPMPIGDAWSLIFFAAGAAGVVALRRRKLKV